MFRCHTLTHGTDLRRLPHTRMIIIHNLFKFGLPSKDMVEIYILYIRSVVENSAVVWHSSLTVADRLSIERVQKVALKIILNERYESYDQALEVSGLQTLEQRRTILCKKFAIKCLKNEKTCDMFPLTLCPPGGGPKDPQLSKSLNALK